MFRNYFKVALRNLLRNKSFSAINITGLAIGMAAAILMLLWVQDELSYDEFHEHKDRIYRVWNRVNIDGKLSCNNSLSEPAGPAIQKDLPEVERVVRQTNTNNVLLSVGERKIVLSGYAVDSGFLQMFTFPLLKGDPATALKDMHSIVLTDKTAKSLFGDADPIGQIVTVKEKDRFKVSGILKDLPTNTKFDFAYLLPWAYKKSQQTNVDFGWNDNSTPTYVLLKENANFASAANKLKELKQRYSADAKELKWELFFYPLERWRLYGSFTNGVEDNGGRARFVKLFGIIAGFVLLIACINFMNLSTARSERRAKEVGIRKAVGALRFSLISQFIGESVLISFVAGIIAVILVELCLPAYNQLVGKTLFIAFNNIAVWAAFIGFILLTGLLAGSYPAFFLSSFKPVKVLKGTFNKVNALITPRKALVIFQFVCATVFIICTLIIKQQINYAQNREMGYNKDNLIYHFLTGDLSKNYQLVKNELIATGVAKSVTKTNSPLTERWSDGWGQEWEGKDPNNKTSFDRYMADEDIGKTAGFKFMQGRDFDLKNFPTDSTGLIINESSLKVMNFKNPIGKTVSDLGVKWHIIGVVKDFILTNPYEPTRPLLICGAKSTFMTFQTVLIKLNGDNATTANLKKAQAIFRKYNPNYSFEYRFVDDAYAEKFENEQLQGTLTALFAGLAIFISCLGLLGLAAYMAEYRVKEIGVRKVLGASVASITTLLSKDFVKPVIIAFIVAAPLSFWSMHNWLQDYQYRISIQWWTFAITCISLVSIAVLTVSFQAVRAALANPVRSLRSE